MRNDPLRSIVPHGVFLCRSRERERGLSEAPYGTPPDARLIAVPPQLVRRGGAPGVPETLGFTRCAAMYHPYLQYRGCVPEAGMKMGILVLSVSQGRLSEQAGVAQKACSRSRSLCFVCTLSSVGRALD